MNFTKAMIIFKKNCEKKKQHSSHILFLLRVLWWYQMYVHCSSNERQRRLLRSL